MTSSIDLQNLSISTTSLTLKDLQPDYARSEMENVVLGLRDRPKQEGTLHELYMTLHEHHPERYPMCRDADGSAKRCSPTCTDCDTMEPRRNSVKAALGRAQGCHDVKWMGRDEDRKVWKATKLATMDEMVWTGHVYTRLSVVDEKKKNDKSKASKSRAGGRKATRHSKNFRAEPYARSSSTATPPPPTLSPAFWEPATTLQTRTQTSKRPDMMSVFELLEQDRRRAALDIRSLCV